MRSLNKIILHCADTRTDQDFSIEDIRSWHIMPKYNSKSKLYSYKGIKYKSISSLPSNVQGRKGRGWSDIGYHYYIKLDGSLHEGRPLSRVGSHCKGHNTGSIGVCFEGGKTSENKPWDKPTDNQIKTVKSLIQSLQNDYGDLSLHGHYEFSSKSCPNFDVCIL